MIYYAVPAADGTVQSTGYCEDAVWPSLQQISGAVAVSEVAFGHISRGNWRIEGGKFLQAEPSLELLAFDARRGRDAKLAASDWTQVPDSPLPPAKRDEWAAYRTELRNISDQPGFPATIAWPTPPAKDAP